jgi:cation diffusion facilitator CzcD-associated flavoprotein CzcO
MYKIAIVGLGPAGIFTLALLPSEILASTIIFEKSAIGGDLATQYSAVSANIPKSAIIDAFRSIPRWANAAFPFLDKYNDDDCPLLGDCVRQLRALIAPDVARAVLHITQITDYIHQSNGSWQLVSPIGLFETQKLVLCTGANPKTLDLPKPIIPLHIALNPKLLQDFVLPTDRIVVLGTAHSGTLVLNNLRTAGVKSLTAMYKGTTPFLYARDGHSEGIKQESATIADSIVADGWAKTISLYDFASTHRALMEADSIVYAIGFERPALTYIADDGTRKPLLHNNTTAEFNVANVYGFGIGFPMPYTGPDGKQYPDVGFGGFILAIKAALPAILSFPPLMT